MSEKIPETVLPTTELVNPATDGLDRLSTFDMLAVLNDEDASVPAAVRTQLPQIARAVDAVADAFSRGGRLIYLGAGTSGRLGILDASECLPTFGVSPEMVFGIIAGGERAITRAIEGAEDDAEAGAHAIDSVAVTERDIVVGISASGGAPFVLAAVARARKLGATTVGLSTSQSTPLSAATDIPIEPVVGPEALQGSTRLKSGTAQKLVLNMLSTGAMIRIGKTYGNRMVDVQSTNKKLIARSRRLVKDVGRVATDELADELLAQAGGSVKLAIVLARRGVDAAAGRKLLEGAHGFLSRVIDP